MISIDKSYAGTVFFAIDELSIKSLILIDGFISLLFLMTSVLPSKNKVPFIQRLSKNIFQYLNLNLFFSFAASSFFRHANLVEYHRSILEYSSMDNGQKLCYFNLHFVFYMIG